MTETAIINADAEVAPPRVSALKWARSIDVDLGPLQEVLESIARCEGPDGICRCSITTIARGANHQGEVLRRMLDLLFARDFVFKMPFDRDNFSEARPQGYIVLKDDDARRQALALGWGTPAPVGEHEIEEVFADLDDDEPSAEAQRYVDFLNSIPFVSATASDGGVKISGHGWLDVVTLSAALQAVRWEPQLPEPPSLPSPAGARAGLRWPSRLALLPHDLALRVRSVLKGRR